MTIVACFEPLWTLAAQLEAIIDASSTRRARREREYSVFEALLFEVLAWTLRSFTRVHENLADPFVWSELRTAVEEAWPSHPDRRLSSRGPSRSQHYRFRKRWLSDYLMEVMHNHMEQAAVDAVQSMGMLAPGVGSLTDPDPYGFVTGDGCWVPAMTKLTRSQAVDAETGEIVGRYDSDALPYRGDDSGGVGGRGYLMVMLLARTEWRQERVVLSTRLKSAYNPDVGRNDATIAVDALLDLTDRNPDLRPGLRGLVYDMALSVAGHDDLLDAGLIPVSKVPLTTTSQIAADNLGRHNFKTATGHVSHVVTAVNGTPCLMIPDGNGIAHYLPLKLRQVTTMKRKTRTQIATLWSVPDNPLAPKHLRGARTRIRHTRTPQQRASDDSRSRALRIFPESDHRFDAIFGRREDSESVNADYKSRLWNGRCRTMDHHSVDFGNVAYQIHTIITALVAYSQRTNTDTTRWFGQLQLVPKRPLALAA